MQGLIRFIDYSMKSLSFRSHRVLLCCVVCALVDFVIWLN